MSAEIVPLAPGEVMALMGKLVVIENELRSWAHEHRQAIAWLTMAESDQKAVDDALNRGDIEAARRANARAKQHVSRARVQRDRAAALTDGMATIVRTFRQWLAGRGL